MTSRIPRLPKNATPLERLRFHLRALQGLADMAASIAPLRGSPPHAAGLARLCDDDFEDEDPDDFEDLEDLEDLELPEEFGDFGARPFAEMIEELQQELSDIEREFFGSPKPASASVVALPLPRTRGDRDPEPRVEEQGGVLLPFTGPGRRR